MYSIYGYNPNPTKHYPRGYLYTYAKCIKCNKYVNELISLVPSYLRKPNKTHKNVIVKYINKLSPCPFSQDDLIIKNIIE